MVYKSMENINGFSINIDCYLDKLIELSKLQIARTIDEDYQIQMNFGSSWRIYARLCDVLAKGLIDYYLDSNCAVFLLSDEKSGNHNSIQEAYKQCQKERHNLMHAALCFEASWKKNIQLNTMK